VSKRLAQDTRNEKVPFWASHQYDVMPSVLVIDLRGVEADAAAALNTAQGLCSLYPRIS